MIFIIDQEVLVSLKNIKTWDLSKKLKARFNGPFEVIKPIKKQAY